MNPMKATFRLYLAVVSRAVVFFYLLGLLGNLIGALYIFGKDGVWYFQSDALFVALRFSLIYGFFTGSGLWIFAKMEEIKRRKKK